MADPELETRVLKAEAAAAGYKRQAAEALETVRQVCKTLEVSETTRRKLLDALLAAEKEIDALKVRTSKLADLELAAKQAMEAAEQVRREGVEALEEARASAKKK